MTHSRTELIAALLLTGQHRIDPVAGPGTRWPPSDAGTMAAAALAAGEPRRARRCLAAAAAEPGDIVPPILAHAADTVDQQWTPGGTGSVLTGETRTPPPEARSTPLGALALVLLPELLTARAMAEDERRAGLTGLAAGSRRRLLAAAERWTGLGPATRSFLSLVRADLAYRDCDHDTAAEAVGQAVLLAAGDAAAQAHIELVRGDWYAEPARHVESLGLPFGPGRAATTARDLGYAQGCYERADRLWSAIGSRGGRCAVALRRAHLARLTGRPDDRTAHLIRAHSLAGEAGHGALAALSTVHTLIDAITDGHRVPPESIDPVVEWARDHGSGSYGRGLLRLLVVRARVWRDDGDFTRSHGALRLARRLAGGTGGRFDGASVSVDLAAVYGGAMYRRARLVLADLDLAAGLADAAGRAVPPLDWVVLAVRAQELFAEANALADPATVDAAAHRLGALLHTGVRPDPRSSSAVADARAGLAAAHRQAPALSRWYKAQRLRDSGLESAALHTFEQALAAAGGDDFLRCAILASIPRPDEALTAALSFAGDLPPVAAASLFLRLGETELAGLALAAVEGTTDPPWTVPALCARLHRRLKDPAEQVRHAERAVELIEQRQQRLARDVLRSATTDDAVVAGVYHDLVTGRLALGATFAALEASDHSRGLPAILLADLAHLPGDARRAARAWLAAGSRWAAGHEEAAHQTGHQAGDEQAGDAPGRPHGHRERRAALDAAEAALDEAEEQVQRTAPGLLRARIAPPRDLRAAAARLPDDAVLLAYHHLDGELIGWAVTADGRVTSAGPVAEPHLAGAAARWHDALARGGSDDDAAQLLAGRLLAPYADRLAGHRRVVIVPHRELAVVPFHALPWDGDVLGGRHDVSYLPAVSLLDRPATGRRPDLRRGALIVGDPAFGTDLRPLPGTRCEALAVADLLGVGDPLIGPAATEARVRELAVGRGVLHLGSHAIVRSGVPHLAHLPLAGTGRLTVAGLLGLDLSADLVVLSACQTGEGTATLGGDLVGLTRAALLAGAAHVVVALWPVHDTIGALLMHAFYGHLCAEPDVGAALARAQRDIRAQSPERLTAAYTTLAARYGAAEAPGMRDATAGPGGGPDPAFGWAPFIHVGV